jgi:hypothetical protein
LIGSSGSIKTKKGRYYDKPGDLWARYVLLAQKRKNRGHFMPQRQRVKNIFDWS